MKVGDIVNPQTLPEGAKFRHTTPGSDQSIWTVKDKMAMGPALGSWLISISSTDAVILELPPPTRRQVRDFLRRLGKTPEEVAKKLAKRGIKGRRRSHCSCPIANALTARFSRQCTMSRIAAGVPGVCLTDAPQAVRDFVGDFDKGKFPELIG